MTTGDREELIFLRVSVARIAQAAGIETRKLRVLGKGTRSQFAMARDNDMGWNDLSAKIAERLQKSVVLDKEDAKILAKALRAYDSSDFASALILKLLGRG